MKKYIIAIFMMLSLNLIFTNCGDMLDPNPNNQLSIDMILDNPEFAEGLLLKAYRRLPVNYDFNDDVVSDDAVTNNPSSFAVTMNNGGWTAQNDPMSAWNGSYDMIVYLNTFLENMQEVEWSWESETQDELFAEKLKGEAHGLRAWYNFMLLQSHGGVGTNGELLGIPLVKKVLTQNDDFEIPRASFTESVNFILEDCDIALQNLPDYWENVGDVNEDRVMGSRNTNRMSGMAVRILRARVVLYAASPTYASSGYTMQQAAEMAADVLTRHGGIGVLDGSDLEFYNDPASSEIIWASSRLTGQTNWESNNFPPSEFGLGRTNPTQDFVDVFPGVDGYPVASGSSYENRDPRLGLYVIYNGTTFKGNTIATHENGGIDAIGVDRNSTRSGYYIRKFLQEGVDIDPALSSPVGGQHFYTYARYTEALLSFAEAANEAVGPTGNVGGFTALEVVNAIRTRAGITSTDYADGLNQDGLRQLIRNERRIELSFEGHRFWDIRRWGLNAVMQSPVSGIQISSDQSNMTVFNVESRNYQDFHRHGPIPHPETLKYDIIQNEGY